jgi:hypothetical protein
MFSDGVEAMSTTEQDTDRTQAVPVESASEHARQVDLARRIASGDVPSLTEIAAELGVGRSTSLAASLIQRTARR